MPMMTSSMRVSSPSLKALRMNCMSSLSASMGRLVIMLSEE